MRAGTARLPGHRLPRDLCAVGVALYVIGIIIASARPGPLAWGFHLSGFLETPQRILVLGLIACGAALLIAALLGRGAPQLPETHSSGGRFLWRMGLLLPLYAIFLWFLRTRTFFLGDGMVWLTILRTGQRQVYSEPLAGAAWWAFAQTLHRLGIPLDPSSLGVFSVLCGALAAVLSIAIVRETVPRQAGWGTPVALLLTLGTAQLYCGYIESYPPVSVAILAYLWLGVRELRGARSPILLAFCLSLAIAFHFICLFLLPSYLYLVLRERPGLRSALLRAFLPLVLLAPILLLIGTHPRQWLQALQIAARAAELKGGPAAIAAHYPVLSIAHARDIANEIALVMPVPAILLIVAFVFRRGRMILEDARARFLLVGTLSGLTAMCAMVLPAPPAQDWDLYSLLLIPAATLGVVAGYTNLAGDLTRRLRLGVCALSLGSVGALVLVNADERAGLERFKTLIGPRAPIPLSAKAYPYSLVASYYEDKGDDAAALPYARLALGAEPTNPRYWLKTGTELYRLGRYEEAVAALEEAARRGPIRADVRHNLGMAHSKGGRPQQGLAELRAAVTLEGGDEPDFYYDLGVGFALAGQPDSTREVWRRLLARWPGYPPAVRGIITHFGREAIPKRE